MPFIEHDLKTLLADMPHPFLQSEVKTLMMQLISAVGHCHANWIVSLIPFRGTTRTNNTSVTPRSQDIQPVDEQSWPDQGCRLWIG